MIPRPGWRPGASIALASLILAAVSVWVAQRGESVEQLRSLVQAEAVPASRFGSTGAIDLLEKPADFRQLIERIEEASSKKAVLFEKRTEEEISDILRKKGW